MRKSLEAVYENGVLRPLEPLNLHEHQHVVVVVSELSPDRAIDELLDVEYLQACAREADHSITLETVREALSRIPGSLTADFVAERDEE